MPQKNIVRLETVYLVKEQKIKFKERKEYESEVYHLNVVMIITLTIIICIIII